MSWWANNYSANLEWWDPPPSRGKTREKPSGKTLWENQQKTIPAPKIRTYIHTHTNYVNHPAVTES